MPNMYVPSLVPGAKSLPAEIKVWGVQNPVNRLRAQHAGVTAAPRVIRAPAPVALAGLAGLGGLRRRRRFGYGLGDDPCDPTDTEYDPTACDGTGGVPGVDGSSSISLPVDNGSPAVVGCMEIGSVGPLAPGQTYCDTGTSTPSNLDIGSSTALSIPGYSGPISAAPGASVPAAPSGYQWASVINSAGQTVAKVLAVANGGAVVTLPNGTTLVTGSANTTVPSSFSSALSSVGSAIQSNPMWILLIGAAVLLAAMEG